MIEITRGTLKNRACIASFENSLRQWNEGRGVCYIGYPIFSTIDGKMPIDGIFIHPMKGIVAVIFFDGTELPTDYKDQLDDVYNKLTARLQGCKALVERRALAIRITVIAYAPAVRFSEDNDDYPICDGSSLTSYLSSIPDDANSAAHYRQALSALQSITTLRGGSKKRQIEKPDSRGAVLRRLEQSIATLDYTQSRAVIETVDGVQRIRGLAGSGKTIVLALKAAYLHAQNPDWNICVTFYSRSLKEQFKRLITAFVIDATSEEPDWEKIHIIHSWGSGFGNSEGVYYNYCVGKNVQPLTYAQAKSRFGTREAFGIACKEAMATKDGNEYHGATFDVILVDEAQDLPAEFLQICYEMLTSTKRLVYAYDEMQSLTTLSLPPPQEIFGLDKHGNPNVRIDSPSQDIILRVCYRNSRPVLTAAHALGFGIYRDPNPNTGTGLIQMFDDKKLWKDVGYEVQSGILDDGQEVTLSRIEETSPGFLEDGIEIDDMIVFKAFDTEEEQSQWVSEEIEKNIREEELLPEDIFVINTNPLTTREKVGGIRARLSDKEILSHLVGVDTSPDVFTGSFPRSVAFSGIFRAKGNEAGMVYVINAQDCYDSQTLLATVRNRLFTGMTRSMAWIRVVGVGEDMRKLVEEYERVKQAKFTLKFKYPTSELRRQLRIVNRDKSNTDAKNIHDFQSTVEALIKKLGAGEVHIEDLTPEIQSQLKALVH